MPIQLHILKASRGKFVNFCYLLLCSETKKAVAVDPAWNIELYRNLLDTNDYELTDILVTHHHFDHINLVPALVSEYGSRVWVSEEESRFYHVDFDNIRLFSSGGALPIETMPITVHLTPGHTLGSCCYQIGNCLFTGDTLFIEGCGMCEGPGADAGTLYQSIQNIKNNIDDSVKVYPGHCYGHLPGQSLEFVKKNNIYMQLDKKEHFIKFRTRKNQVYSEFL